MAQNEAVFAIRITDNGTLQIVQKDAKKAAAGLNDLGAAVDRTAESQNNFNRGQKGVAGATSNGTKAFSKMRDAIGGSSGLVGAYATLAANLFALSAAFNALSRAAKIDQLAKSIEVLGASSGTNLKRVADNLKSATDNAISMGDAMKAASFGTSAGFNTSQLETLAKVAKGASAALDRDLKESYDRLVRGAAKLEPEILDELGIIVRLDKATSDYAAKVGKAVKDLTTWERQQAFINAINEQGIKKYGELADSIEPTAYEKLAAAVQNVSNSFLGAIATSGTLTTFLNYIANNSTALVGVVITLGSMIKNELLKPFTRLNDILADFAGARASKAFESLKVSLSGISGSLGKNASIAVGTFVEKLEKGEATQADLTATQETLTRSLGRYNTLLSKSETNVSKLTADLQLLEAAEVKDVALIEQTRAALQKATATRDGYNGSVARTKQALDQSAAGFATQNAALAKNKVATGVAEIGALNLFSGWKNVTKGLSESLVPLSSAASGIGKVGVAAKNIGTVVAGGFSAAFATFLALSTVIGILTSMFPAIEKWFKDTFFPESEIERKIKGLESITKKTDELSDHIRKVESNIVIDVKADKLDTAIEGVIRFAGVMREIADVIAGSFDELRTSFKAVAEEAGVSALKAEQLKNNLERSALEKQAKDLGVQDIREYNPGQYTGVDIKDEVRRRGVIFKLKEQILDLDNTISETQNNINNLLGEADKAAASELVKTLRTRAEAYQLSDSRIISTMQGSQKAQAEADSKAAYEAINTLLAQREAVLNQMLKDAITPEGIAAVTEYAKQIQTDVNKELNTRVKPWEDFKSAVAGSADEVTKLGSELERVSGASEGKWASLKKALEGVSVQLNGVKGDKLSEATATALQPLLNQLTGANLSGTRLVGTLDSLIQAVDRAQAAEFALPGLKQAKDNATALAQQFPNIVTFEQQRIKASEDLRVAEIASLMAEKDILVAVGAQKQKIAELDNQIAAKTAERIQEAGTVEAVEQRLLDLANQRKQTLQEAASINAATSVKEISLNNFRTRGTTELTITQKLKAIEDEKAAKLSMLKLELNISNSRVKAEKAIAEIKIAAMDISEAEKANLLSQLNYIDLQIAANEELYNAKVRAAEVDASTARVSILEPIQTGPTKTTSSIISQNGTMFDSVKYQEDVDAAVASAKEKFAKAPESLQNIAGILAGAKQTAAPFLESMRQLGPEGETTALVVQGALAIGDAWTNVGAIFSQTGKDAASGLEKGAAVASALGATIGAIASAQAAASQQRIASIDSEIAAEQKRDGKSKESLAKIAALEKKKEQEKRKAFEQDKKMKMGEAIMNTAAGIMSALSKQDYAGAAIIAAIGAAQLAIIASTSYQGGGAASTAAGAPTSIAVGQRTNSVDLAKSQSASGELAYLRGEQGMGGPEAFTPAFTGMKYRASGGATTGFMVGEQGPELFIPDRPGTIVPADQTANMGGVTNVNFSISAIDTQGVEDMLENQKGAIINMIRSAANSYGQPFIEQVDTSVYRPAPKSRTYRR